MERTFPDTGEMARLRQQAETRARELEATVEAITDAVFVYDRHGQIVRTNSAARTLFDLDANPGYETRAPDERATLIQVRDEQGRPIPVAESGLQRLLQGETLTGANALDVRLRVPAGRELQINISGAPLRDEAGEVIGAVAVARDVTDRRRLERELAERASTLEGTIEAMTDGVVLYGPAGEVRFTNAAYRRMLALDDALLEAPLAERGQAIALRHPATGDPLPMDEWPVVRLLRGEAFTGPQSVDMLVRAHDGRESLISCAGAPVHDERGQIQGAVMVVRDVGERRQLERRTSDALDALLELAAAMVSDPTVDSDVSSSMVPGPAQPTSDIVHRFATLCSRVLGCERIAIIAVEPGTDLLRTVAVAGASPEQEQRFRAGFSAMRLTDRFGAEIAARLLAGETVLVDVDHLRPDDPARLLSRRHFLIAPMLAAGALNGYLGANFGDDESHYTAENRALALAVAQLVGIVMERARLTRERTDAQAREAALAEANRRMDEFLSIASHELRTPLTSVTANVQLAERQLRALVADPLPSPADGTARPESKIERAAQLLERTRRQVYRLDRLVGDLLDVTRIQAGKLELRIEALDLLAIVREAVEGQRTAWPNRVITLDLPRRDGIMLQADPDRIGQVLVNFLTNALKYSPEDQPVTVRVRSRGDTARVEVRDHGPGLSVEQQAHLFERFSRVPGIEQQSGSGVGLGLGLYICKSIIERHGGAVGVESKVGQGSTFWFTLPRAEPVGA